MGVSAFGLCRPIELPTSSMIVSKGWDGYGSDGTRVPAHTACLLARDEEH